MPRYYFHVGHGQITLPDHEGIELSDTVDAEVEAAQRSPSMVDSIDLIDANWMRSAKSYF